MSAYAGTFLGYPIAFINPYFSFLSKSSHFVSPVNFLAIATYIRVCFRFDKGGTGNLQERNFCRFPIYRSSYCPLLAALYALYHLISCNIDPLTSIFC